MPFFIQLLSEKKMIKRSRDDAAEEVLVGYARNGDFANLQKCLICNSELGSAVMHKVSHECTATIASNNAAFDSTRAEFLRELQQM
jgi:hypothetical protein